VVDFILRLLMIEKSIAVRYQETDFMATEAASTEQPDEAAPLLQDRFSARAPQIPMDQSKLVRKFPFLYLLSNASLMTALVITLVQGIMYSSFDATLPIFTKEVFGFNSSQAGLLFITIGLTDMISGPFVGWMVDRYGTKRIATAAYIYLAGGLLALRAVTHGSTMQLTLYGLLLAICGIGLGLIATPSLVESGAVAQWYYKANPKFFGRPPYAQIYGLSSTFYMAGLSLGPLVAGELKEAIGYGNMTTALGGLCMASAVLAWYFLGVTKVQS
jgi:MFS family permease